MVIACYFLFASIFILLLNYYCCYWSVFKKKMYAQVWL